MAKERCEDALSKLEKIVSKLEEGDIPLEESLKLFEEGIRDDNHITVENDQLLIDGIPDELALIFRFLSRYEEYQPHERDEHARYKSANSELVKLGLHHKPVVDLLNKNIWQKLGLDYSIVERGFEYPESLPKL